MLKRLLFVLFILIRLDLQAQGIFPLTATRVVVATSQPATCTPGQVYFQTTATVGLYLCTSTDTWVLIATGEGAAQQHSITFVIDGGGSVVATGDLEIFPTATFSCTINRIDVSADQAGSVTVDIWKRAGAIPTSAQKISASAPATLSSAQLNQNGSLTGWTTAVSSGDVFGGTVVTATTVTRVVVQIWCD